MALDLSLALTGVEEFRRYVLDLRPLESKIVAPTDTAIDLAWRFADCGHHRELPTAAVVWSPEGGVAICFAEDGEYADIECFNDGEVLGSTSVGIFDVDPSCEIGVESAISRIAGALGRHAETVPPQSRV
jgi:hypothetical protein